jgi:hypothetical protein
MSKHLSYAEWLKKYKVEESPDYNTHEAYFAGVVPDARGHLPDTYKLPNHITYSDESIYSKQPNAPPPGQWKQLPDGKWQFWASPTNVENAGSTKALQDYFNKYEPDSQLFLPPMGPSLDKLFGR